MTAKAINAKGKKADNEEASSTRALKDYTSTPTLSDRRSMDVPHCIAVEACTSHVTEAQPKEVLVAKEMLAKKSLDLTINKNQTILHYQKAVNKQAVMKKYHNSKKHQYDKYTIQFQQSHAYDQMCSKERQFVSGSIIKDVIPMMYIVGTQGTEVGSRFSSHERRGGKKRRQIHRRNCPVGIALIKNISSASSLC
ncbi:hypothetical protein BDB00DRAFT_866802 [Zychaea mexicana]|uniref:uncharacterized protein n=1 Tax=Zychaea mexicana TaxID=64656 RepID=UPI0022FEAEA7|nr:uncharacterized protein BDB00DRAFT_866802 [Zychaea mexicana]KAI9499316.1 hypothetical protein BDB00DRAFT_866802 [Zychaea mexicana]